MARATRAKVATKKKPTTSTRSTASERKEKPIPTHRADESEQSPVPAAKKALLQRAGGKRA